MRLHDVFDECFELSASPQCIVGRDGRVRAMNRACRSALGVEEGAPLPEMARYAEDAGALAGLLAAEWPETGVPLRLRLPGGRRAPAQVRALRADDGLLHVEILPVEAVAQRMAPGDGSGTQGGGYGELDRVTAMIAHDLRTPIGQITAAMQLCRCAHQRGAAGDEDGGLFWLDVAEAATARMSELVAGLLARARAGEQGLIREETDLATLLHDAAAAHQRELADAGAVIDCTPLAQVYGDRLLLRQVFANLISNALKYRAPGRRLRISVDQRAVPGGVELSFRDNGRGFDASEAELLFDPFQRGAGTQGIEGVGFGLASCRTIVERHGWSIRASGEPGIGATITISIAAADCLELAAVG